MNLLLKRLLIMRLDLLILVLSSTRGTVLLSCLLEYILIPVFIAIVHLHIKPELLGLLIIEVIAPGVNNTILPLPGVTSKVDVPISLRFLLPLPIVIAILFPIVIALTVAFFIPLALLMASFSIPAIAPSLVMTSLVIPVVVTLVSIVT